MHCTEFESVQNSGYQNTLYDDKSILNFRCLEFKVVCRQRYSLSTDPPSTTMCNKHEGTRQQQSNQQDWEFQGAEIILLKGDTKRHRS